MAINASDLFNAESKTVNQLFANNTEGFYIPVYQRPYTWEYSNTSKTKKNINKLFDDIFHGMETLLKYDNAYTFLGAIILVKDEKYEMVQPIYEFEMPRDVYHIIDGQQRMSTILLVLISTLREMSKGKKQLKSFNSESSNGLFKLVDRMTKNLHDCVHIAMENKYPKMIRGVVDVWSQDKDEAIYSSPISNYLDKYFDNAVNLFMSDKNTDYKVVQDAIKGIDKAIKNIQNDSFSDDADIDPPLLADIFKSEIYNEFLDKEMGIFKSAYEETNNEKILPILRLYIFAKYLLQRVAITTVISNDDSYAFSIFEALNTAGEPLTAFETFKPRALENIRQIKDGIPKELELIQNIEKNLAHAKSNDKIKATQELVMAHALAECGERVGKHLVGQRHYMRKSFDNTVDYAKYKIKKINENSSKSYNDDNNSEKDKKIDHEKVLIKQYKITYLDDLYDLSEFITKIWHGDGISSLISHDKEAICAFKFLKIVGKKITIPILFRFSKLSKTLKNESYLAEAIKATASFFALWRSMRASGDGSDKCYRDLLINNIVSSSSHSFISKYKIVDNEFITSNLDTAISKQDHELAQLTIHDLKANYRHILSLGKGYTNNKKDEVSYLDSRERYKNLLTDFDISVNSTIIKYLLMITDDNKEVLKIWNNNEFSTAIQVMNPNSNSNDVLDNIRAPNFLGNYILFPDNINNMIENKSWNDKLEIFNLYQSSDPEDVDKLSRQSGLNIEILKETLNNSPKITINLSSSSSEYKNIRNRTSTIADKIWNILAIKYLGFED